MLVGTHFPFAFGLFTSTERIVALESLISHLVIIAEVTQNPDNLPVSFEAQPSISLIPMGQKPGILYG